MSQTAETGRPQTIEHLTVTTQVIKAGRLNLEDSIMVVCAVVNILPKFDSLFAVGRAASQILAFKIVCKVNKRSKSRSNPISSQLAFDDLAKRLAISLIGRAMLNWNERSYRGIFQLSNSNYFQIRTLATPFEDYLLVSLRALP